MKIKRFITPAFAMLIVTSLTVSVRAQSSKMPTEPLGGKPPAGSKPSVENLADQVTYQRAFEAVIWSMPAVAKYGLHRATFDMGAGNNVVLAWSAGAKPLFEALTPNNTTPYVNGTTDLRKGPVVLDVPPATDKASLFGQVADNWYITIADIGPIGVDKGKGGKILLTPPGYTGKVPAGFIEVKSPSYILDFAFRSIPTPDGTPQDAYELGQKLQVYYLSELPNPKPTKFIDPLNKRWPTLCRYDERWFEDLHEIIDVEPVRERDKAMMGMLKHIGIEKGKPYNPDAEDQGDLPPGGHRCLLLHAAALPHGGAGRALLAGPEMAQRLLLRSQHGLQLGLGRDARLRQPVDPSLVHGDLLPEQGHGHGRRPCTSPPPGTRTAICSRPARPTS